MRACVIALVASITLAACGDSDGAEGPVIDEIQPTSAAPGTTVEVLGDRFCGDTDDTADAEGLCNQPPASLVNFGEDQEVVRANIASYSHTRISVVVPDTAAAGATVVVVLRDGIPSNTVSFDVL